ncbi:MAG: carboxypeptidase-like regulatory domain-containing protein [Bacteroidota bacterium]
MQRTHRKTLGLLLILFGFSFLVHAQTDEPKEISLLNHIKQLESRYDVKFSFLNGDIENLTISTLPAAQNLQQELRHIQERFQFKIDPLSDRYYAIVKRSLVNVCGSVLDNFAQNSIPGATIEVMSSQIAVMTDAKGGFQLESIPRNATLKIRYLGFNTKYVQVEDLVLRNGCSEILLSQFYQQLKEVVVYKFLTTGIIKEEDASITINTKDFGILPGLIEPDVLQTVQALPGIKSIDETVSDINVRGGTNDQNLILWNGIKMYQSGHFFGLISAFNPYLTEKVTVIKNGTPARYGDGVSSVIAMESKNSIEDQFSGGAGFNFISGDLFGQLPINERLAVQFSARRSTTDFLNTPTYDRFFDRAFQDSEVTDENNIRLEDNFEREENFFFYDFTGKVLYDLNEDHKLRFNLISISNELEFSETNRSLDETTNSFLQQTNLSFGGQWSGQWTDRFQTHLNVYYSRYDLDAINLFANQVQLLLQNNEVLEGAAKLDTQYVLSEALRWNNGYQFIETGITNTSDVTQPPFQSNVKGVIRVHAPYSSLQYRSSEKKLLTEIGLRTNIIQNLGTFTEVLWEPRFNVNVKLANHLRAQLLGEFKSQTTNQVIDLEQNFLGIEKRRWIISDNEELPITKSKQASLGVNYELNDFYFGLEGFYKRVDGISTRTQGFQNQNQFSGEIGHYDIHGVELLINKRGLKYSTWLSYAYNKNDYTFDMVEPNTFPNNLDIRHTLTLASTYEWKDLKIGAGLNYRTGKPFTEPIAEDAINTNVFPAQINFEEPNSSRLPEYLRLDASAVYNLRLGRRVKGNVGVSVLNITNRRNVLNTYFRLTDDNQIETVENISLGITPNISFRVSF